MIENVANQGPYCVYMHRLFDGRVYIGITSKSTSRRWQKGEGYKRSMKFYHAIKKYGWDAFEHIVLFEGLTKEEAEAKEIELIKLYDSASREHGFNVQLGGSSFGKMSEESKDLIRKKKIGLRASAETKEKMSKSRKGKKQSPEHIKKRAATRIGTHLSEETKRKISEARRGQKINKVFSEEEIKNKRENSPRNRPILQYSKDGRFIKEFYSLSEAARTTGASVAGICNAATGVSKTSVGYVWKYKEAI